MSTMSSDAHRILAAKHARSVLPGWNTMEDSSVAPVVDLRAAGRDPVYADRLVTHICPTCLEPTVWTVIKCDDYLCWRTAL